MGVGMGRRMFGGWSFHCGFWDQTDSCGFVLFLDDLRFCGEFAL